MKRLLVVLMVVLMICTISIPISADEVTNGLDLTNVNEDKNGEGWQWNSSEKTLTLSGINIEEGNVKVDNSSEKSAAIAVPDGTRIVVTEDTENTITSANNYNTYGIYGEGELEISGKGKLSVVSGSVIHKSRHGGSSFAIYSKGTLKIKDADLKAIGGNALTEGPASISVGLKSNDIVISNSDVTSIGGIATRSIGIGSDYDGKISISESVISAISSDGKDDTQESYSYGMTADINITISESKVVARSGIVKGDYDNYQPVESIAIRSAGDLEITSSDVEAVSGMSDVNSIAMQAWKDASIDDSNLLLQSGEGDRYSCGLETRMSLKVDHDSDIRASAAPSKGNSYGLFTRDLDINDGPIELRGYTQALYLGYDVNDGTEPDFDMIDYINHVVYVDPLYKGINRTIVEDDMLLDRENRDDHQYILITTELPNENDDDPSITLAPESSSPSKDLPSNTKECQKEFGDEYIWSDEYDACVIKFMIVDTSTK